MKEAEVLKISKILDKTTFIITGVGIAQFKKDDLIQVLYFEEDGVETGTPLALIKATLSVTEHAGLYLIARPPYEQREEFSGLAAISIANKRTVQYRPEQNVEENDVFGNPSKKPIAIGDYVIKKGMIEEFVRTKSNSKMKDSV